jgi:ABC-type nitrate/sulfonate/bicarbonate transport system permease component
MTTTAFFVTLSTVCDACSGQVWVNGGSQCVREFIAADRGLGYLVTSSTAFFRTSLAFGAVVLLYVIGIVLFQAVVLVERVFFPWSATISRSL